MTDADTALSSPHETPGRLLRPRDRRYTRVAIWLHWAIAALIIYNIAIGFFNWDFGYEFTHRPENRGLMMLLVVSHFSAGLTVLALTVVRIVWRLLHEPPPYPAGMKPLERHAAHFAHFLLYAAMLLMPLTGWAMISAHPPAGSAGAQAKAEIMAKKAAATGAPAAPAPAKGPAAGKPPTGGPKIWWLFDMPSIKPIENIGKEPGGLPAQDALHDDFANWHGLGAWLTVLVLLLHVAGALKHQWIDREPELQRMGLGKFPEEKA